MQSQTWPDGQSALLSHWKLQKPPTSTSQNAPLGHSLLNEHDVFNEASN